MGQSKSKSNSSTSKSKQKEEMLPAQQMLIKEMREFSNDDYKQHSEWTLSNGIILHIADGDICKFHGDAIVNSANEKMLGGGGVDGAIHRGAGDELREYIKDNIPTLPDEPFKRCLTGNAIITPGFLLNVPYIIHTAGPMYNMVENPSSLLQSCYTNCLKLAEENKLKSVAFSAVSCGAFKYPKEDAMEIAFTVCNEYTYAQNSSITDIWFIVMAKGMYQICVDVAMDMFDCGTLAEEVRNDDDEHYNDENKEEDAMAPIEQNAAPRDQPNNQTPAASEKCGAIRK